MRYISLTLNRLKVLRRSLTCRGVPGKHQNFIMVERRYLTHLMYKVKIRRVFRTGHHHPSSSVIKCTTILSKQNDSSVRHRFSFKFTATRPPFLMWLLRNWVESQSRPIRKKTLCSEKSGCLTGTNLDFDFEIGNSDFAVKHEIQKRFSKLRNPFSKWISIKKSSNGSHGFLCFAFFREIQKGSPLEGVSMRLTVGYKKKKRTDFSVSKSVLRFISYNKIRYLYFKILIRIYQSKAPRTLEPLSQYSTSIPAYCGLF